MWGALAVAGLFAWQAAGRVAFMAKAHSTYLISLPFLLGALYCLSRLEGATSPRWAAGVFLCLLLAIGLHSMVATLAIPAGANPCGGGAGCSITIHTTDNDVPATAARDAAINIFPPVTASKDFNGDGRADLLWQNRSSGQVGIWLMNGATVLSSPRGPVVGDLNWQIFGVGDFNGDGNADILWQNRSSGQVGKIGMEAARVRG